MVRFRYEEHSVLSIQTACFSLMILLQLGLAIRINLLLRSLSIQRVVFFAEISIFIEIHEIKGKPVENLCLATLKNDHL